MRARQFFTILEHGRKLHRMETYAILGDLCDVMLATYSFEAYKDVRKELRERAFGPVQRKPLDMKDDKTALIIARALHAATPKGVH